MSATVDLRVPQAVADALIAAASLLSREIYDDTVKTVQVSEIITQLAALNDHAPLCAGRVSELGEAVQVGIGLLEAATVTVARLLAVELAPVVAAEVIDLVTGDAISGTEVPEVTERAVADELRLACGLVRITAWERVRFALAPPTRTVTLRRELYAGTGSWWRVNRVFSETSHLPDEAVEAIARVVFARNLRDGRPVSAAGFRARLRRQLAHHRQVQADEDRAAFAPDVQADCADDGTGCLTITGDSIRVAAGFDRCDQIARHLRARGDTRSLAELRAAVALDLILYGQFHPHQQSLDLARDTAGQPKPVTVRSPGEHEPPLPKGLAAGSVVTNDGEVLDRPDWFTHLTSPDWKSRPDADLIGLGALPAASVHVVVSLASLLGVTRDLGEVPGHCHLTARHARDAALAAGSVWRRLVTDPLTGILSDLSAHTYRPSAHLSRTVRARDHGSRDPLTSTAAGNCDLDHITPWPAGTTEADNLIALSRHAHRTKTRRLATTEILPDGTYLWRTLTGRTYPHQPAPVLRRRYGLRHNRFHGAISQPEPASRRHHHSPVLTDSTGRTASAAGQARCRDL